MRRLPTIAITLSLVASFGVAYAAGQWLRTKPTGSVMRPPINRGTQVAEATDPRLSLAVANPVSGAESVPQAGFSLFETVYGLVRTEYVDALPDKSKMAHGAVKALVASLEDPNSSFVDASQRKLLERESTGILAGIGAALSVRARKVDGFTDYRVVVIDPLPGSPAEAAGIKSGDVVLRIDGKYVFGHSPLLAYNRVLQRWQDRDISDEEVEKARKSTKDRIEGGMPFKDAELLLRGDKLGVRSDAAKQVAKKERVRLTVERDGKSVDVQVTFGETKVPSATMTPLNASTVLLKIPYFSASAGKDVRTALTAAAGKKLVIDLRGNPGGDVDAGKAVAGAILGPGIFCAEIGPRGVRKIVKTTGGVIKTGPVVVLVDRGTASVAEALTACLVERRQVTVVGQTTFGDGALQGVYTLDDGTGFTLTVGILTGNKTAWPGKGITPSVLMPATTPPAAVLNKAVLLLGGAK